MKLALVRPETTTALAFADALFGTFRFNNKRALDNGPNFKQLLGSQPDKPDDPTRQAALVDALLQFKPHVILYLPDPGLAKGVFEPVESRWPERLGYGPRYISAGTSTDDMIAFAAASSDRRKRVLGVEPALGGLAWTKFAARYAETFPERYPRSAAPGGTYDAVYMLAYGAYASQGEQTNGAAIARGFARLVGGSPIEVGPTKILEAAQLLRDKKAIDLQGVGGRLDLDPATGESPSDMSIFCVASPDAKMAAISESGVTYDAAQKKLRGKLRCR
jgi:hypothetical protein